MPAPSSSAGRVRAKTMNKSATGALVMKRFCPLMIQSEPSRTAFVRRPDGFDPAPDSVSANEATRPDTIGSSQRAFCSSVPNPTITCPAMPLLVPNIDRSASDVYPNSMANSTS